MFGDARVLSRFHLWLQPELCLLSAKKHVSPLLATLKEQKDMKLKGSIYHRTQIDLTYNSNHIRRIEDVLLQRTERMGAHQRILNRHLSYCTGYV